MRAKISRHIYPTKSVDPVQMANGSRRGPRNVVPGRITTGPSTLRFGKRVANARKAATSSIRANAAPMQ